MPLIGKSGIAQVIFSSSQGFGGVKSCRRPTRLFLIYKAFHPPLRFVPQSRAHGKHGRAASDVAADFRVVRWQNRWREPAVWIPMLLGLLLLFLPFYGRALVQAR